MKNIFNTGLLLLCILCCTRGNSQAITLWGLNSPGYNPDTSYNLNYIFSVKGDGTAYAHKLAFPYNYPGYNPAFVAPIMASNGKFYSTLTTGGYYYNYPAGEMVTGYGVIYNYDTTNGVCHILHTFKGIDGSYPAGGLMQASDGNVYGMCQNGDADFTNTYAGYGNIYRINPVNNQFDVLHEFTYQDGALPTGGLTAVDTMLYGMTVQGGTQNEGVIFKINPRHNTYTVLYNFGSGFGDGANPGGNLSLGTDGNLYALTNKGGVNNLGALIKYNITTNTCSTMHSFSGGNPTGDGLYPEGSLVVAANGLLYGYSNGAGGGDRMAIFHFNTSTDSFHVIKNFGSGSNQNDGGSMYSAPDGYLYGALTSGNGFIFKINPATDSITTLFIDSSYLINGCVPWGGVTYNNGSLYGVMAGCDHIWPEEGGGFFKYDLQQQHYTRLYQFGQFYACPDYMVKGSGNNYYLSSLGGYNFNTGHILQYNTVSGQLDTLVFFPDSNGLTPVNITMGPGNILYAPCNAYTGLQSVYSGICGYNINTGQLNIVHTFNNQYVNFKDENSLCVAGSKLYGTISGAGVDTGILFSLDPVSRQLDTLIRFNGPNGIFPGGNTIYDGQSKIYSTTQSGGPDSAGVLFSYNLNTNAYTIEHSFMYATGAYPTANIVRAPNHRIFGSLLTGTNAPEGSIYCYNPDSGTYRTLINFQYNSYGNTFTRLMLASDGQIYGTVQGQGMFRISPDSLTVTWLNSPSPRYLYSDIPQQTCATVYTADTPTICAGHAYNGHTTTGTYTDTLLASTGCDSIVTSVLTVMPTLHHTLTQAICQGATFYIGTTAYTQAGNYTDTITSTRGCDSIVSLTLTVNPLPVVTLSWDSLIADGYLLQDTFNHRVVLNLCAHDSIILAGGYPFGGSYSGIFISNNIIYNNINLIENYDSVTYTYTDTNGCSAFAINRIYITICEGINETAINTSILIYPNPATDQLFIKTENIQPVSISVYDVDGRMIFTQPFNPTINIGRLSSGVYFVEVKSNEGVGRKRFVKM